jgi:hypothetical protein
MGVILPLISLGHVEFVVAYVDLALVKYALPPNGCVPPHIPLDLVIPINNEVEHPIYETQDPTIIDARFVEHSYNTSTTCCKILHGMKTLK